MITSLIYDTEYNYEIGRKCEVIFQQDNEEKCCLALPMEQSFEDVLLKNNE